MEPDKGKPLIDYLKFAVNKVPFYSKFKNRLEDINYKNFFEFPITYDYDLINNPFPLFLQRIEWFNLPPREEPMEKES